ERIKAIANARGLDHEKILLRIFVAKALDSTLQESCIREAGSNINFETNSISNKIKLLIVDSMTNHYRAEYAGRSRLPERLQRLNKPLHMLLKTAHTNAAAVEQNIVKQTMYKDKLYEVGCCNCNNFGEG
ncbi:MAG: hypothetical protein WAZ77_16115, partial [Candidatus Nitrosopolaris sp.]